jgi:hypothetical protein
MNQLIQNLFVMPKKILFAVALSLSMMATYAQNPVGKGGKQINFGTGFSSWGIPLYFGMDFGVHSDITAGFVVSARTHPEVLVLGFTGVGNYHFNRILEIPNDWDLYAGLSLGFFSWNWDSKYSGRKNSPLGLDLQIGGRYFWSDDWGVNLELGGGSSISGGRIGLTRKL